MRFDEEHFAWMADRWRARFGREIPAANRQQAMIPEGATKLRNHHGSAPGIWLEDERGRWVAMLPGVPREMRGMLGDTLLPLLRARVNGDRVDPLAHPAHHGRPRIAGGRARGGDRRRRARGVAGLSAERRRRRSAAHRARRRRRTMPTGACRPPLAGCARRSASDLYAEGDADLAAVVLDACRGRGLKIAVAESCTGGMVGERLTGIPGSSDVFVGGVIAYADGIKTALLGVPAADHSRARRGERGGGPGDGGRGARAHRRRDRHRRHRHRGAGRRHAGEAGGHGVDRGRSRR